MGTLEFHFHVHGSIPAVVDLHGSTDIPEAIEHIDHFKNPIHSSSELHDSILYSKDTLLFTSYTPEDTMMRKWFLIQADLNSSASLHSNFAIHNLYYCIFLARHPGDKALSDEFSQWWPDWYR